MPLKRLKTLLQQNSFYFILLILTTLYLCINLFLVPNESKYQIDENEFILTIENIRYKEDKVTIEFSGQENLISYYKDDFPYSLGDKVKVIGTLKEANNNTIPNLFNYKKYLYNNDIHYILDINEIIPLQKNNNLIFKIKNFLINRIENISPNKEYLYAFILGETYYIDSDIKDNYQFNGVSHLLAIGSSSITIITCLVTYLFHKFKINDYLYLLFMIILVFIYIVLTNYSVSIIRCGLAFILTYINKKLKLNIKYQNLLILITSISLFYNPYYVYNLGFQYSYLISFVLVIYNDLITGNYLVKLLKVSMIAYLVSIPINIYNNFEVNFFSIILNLLYVPLVNFIIFPLSLIVLFFPFLNGLLSIVINFTESITSLFSNVTFFSIVLAKPNLFIVIVYYIVIFLFLYGWRHKMYYLYLPFVIIMFIHFNINHIIKEDFVMMMDVKQGDCILLKSNDKVVLIDTGGSYNYEYSDNIVSYLKSIGINKIDYLFITHGDMDHIGSSYSLVEKIRLERVYFNSNDYNENELRLIKQLKKKNIYYQKISNENFKINNFSIKAISYDLGNENDSSLMLLVKNKLKFLLMGDASIKSEDKLLNEYNLSNFDIIKLGHHGSYTSTGERLIRKIKPNIGLISVGKNNLYKHPSKVVLDRLENTNIYRTDYDGSVLLKIKNNKLHVKTYAP